MVDPPGQDTAQWFPTAGMRAAATTRIVCLPALGGGVMPYATWHDLLPPWIEPLPVLFPACESRVDERPYTRLPALVHDLCGHVEAVAGEQYAIFGYCFGAVVAFELTRALERRGSGPKLLWIHGQASPVRRPRLADPDADAWDRFCAYAEIPPTVRSNTEYRDLLLPVLRTQIAMLDTYHCEPGARVSAPVVVSRGRDDRQISGAEARAWADVAPGDCEVKEFAGAHALDREPRELLDALVGELTARVTAPDAPA